MTGENVGSSHDATVEVEIKKAGVKARMAAAANTLRGKGNKDNEGESSDAGGKTDAPGSSSGSGGGITPIDDLAEPSGPPTRSPGGKPPPSSSIPATKDPAVREGTASDRDRDPNKEAPKGEVASAQNTPASGRGTSSKDSK